MSKGPLRELNPGPFEPEAILHHEPDVMICGNPRPGDYGHRALPAAPLPSLQLAKYRISVPSQPCPGALHPDMFLTGHESKKI
jgi:hypothetical protein